MLDRTNEEIYCQKSRLSAAYDALGGSRTHTPYGTWPSTMPVYQFQHQREINGLQS